MHTWINQLIINIMSVMFRLYSRRDFMAQENDLDVDVLALLV